MTTTILPELEVKQAFNFFAMGKDTLNLDDYLKSLKNVGIVFNKQEIMDINESGKTEFTEADFVKDYNNKMKTISFDVLNRALVTYGERLSKEEANRFFQVFKIKHGEPISYNELVEELIKI